MELEGRVAIVTGGARGIGRGIAIELARAGADVAIADLSSIAELAADAAATAAEVRALGRRAVSVDCDVSDPDACDAAIATTVAELGGLDILVCNAGIAGIGGVAETSAEQWERVLKVNTTGAFLMAKAALPHFEARGGGSIVNIASVLGMKPSGKRISYSVSKAALVALTQGLAQEGASKGIRVNAVCPSSVRSQMTVGEVREVTGADSLEEADARWTEIAKKVVPLGRSVEPEDIGRSVVGLCSAEMVTGAIVPVTGGESL